ncbi:MAG: DUF802 domain-containing protein [Pseudomonadales bacterium]
MQIKKPNQSTITKLLFIVPTALGAIAIVWVATLFIGTDSLALLVTLLIGCAYAIGVAELINFRGATSSLQVALTKIPESINKLDEWLSSVHSSLQNSVRLRIESERVGLPAPVLTPYLVGLLVMLGLLGTFIGMVDTLGGAVTALEGSTELQAIRKGLAAPINGLSLAFGTSVAGVAASAMLGLLSTLSRRERMMATRSLDAKIATDLRHFSLTHNRQQTYDALQAQAEVMPELTKQMQQMIEHIGKMGDTLSDKLIANQSSFQQTVHGSFTDLATSVDKSLTKTLAESSRQTGVQLETLVSDSLHAMTTETKNTQQHLTQAAEQQLGGLAAQFAQTTEQVSAAWKDGLGAQQNVSQQLLASFGSASSSWVEQAQAGDGERLKQWEASLSQLQEKLAAQLLGNSAALTSELKSISDAQQSSLATATDNMQSMSQAVSDQLSKSSSKMEQLVDTFGGASAEWVEQSRAGDAERLKQWEASLSQLHEQLAAQLLSNSSALSDELKNITSAQQSSLLDATNNVQDMSQALTAQWTESSSKMEQLSDTVAGHVAQLGKELEEPMARLIETASETPKAAAEVISQLRNEMTNNVERDNTLLSERKTLMEQLDTLSRTLQTASTQQHESVAKLVASSTSVLEQVSSQFSGHIETELEKITTVADHFAGSAAEMSSLGESFSVAVQQYSESNAHLVEQLNRIEQSMDASGNRSDQQMAYYVAQAREIIDQSLLSQKEMIDELQALSPDDDAEGPLESEQEQHTLALN